MSDYRQGPGQGDRPAPVKHALNDFRFRMVGQERLEGAPRPPSLGFNITREGIALNAYTNVQGDEENGRISAELSYQDAVLFFIMLEKAPRLSPGMHEELAIAMSEYDRNTNSRKAKAKMSLKVGRDDAGVIYIEVASWKRTRPVVRIHMLPSNLLRLNDSRGEPAPKDKVSELVAVQWAKSLSTLVPSVYAAHYVPPKDRNSGGFQRDNNGGGGGYGGQQRGYDRGGYDRGGAQGNGSQGGYPQRGGSNSEPPPRNDTAFASDGFDDLPL